MQFDFRINLLKNTQNIYKNSLDAGGLKGFFPFLKPNLL